MTKEISKGTQKFIWHLVAFVAVFILAMTILNRILPETTRTTTYDQPPQTTVSTQSTDNYSTDFDSVKERVDAANNSTGKEVKSLYSGEGKSTMQKQLETRLFFNTLHRQKQRILNLYLNCLTGFSVRTGSMIKNSLSEAIGICKASPCAGICVQHTVSSTVQLLCSA